MVLLPTHRSYVDFLFISYIFFAHNLPLPYIAAGDDFLLSRRALCSPRRRRLLHQAVQLLSSVRVSSWSVRAGAAQRRKRRRDLRRGQALEDRHGVYPPDKAAPASHVPPGQPRRQSGAHIHRLRAHRGGELVLRRGDGRRQKSKETPRKLAARRCAFVGKLSRNTFGCASIQFGDIINSSDDAKVIDDAVAAMRRASVCMPTHMLAAILLWYRHGVAREQLAEDVEWLRAEIVARGGRVQCAEGWEKSRLVKRAGALLSDLIVTRNGVEYWPLPGDLARTITSASSETASSGVGRSRTCFGRASGSQRCSRASALHLKPAATSSSSLSLSFSSLALSAISSPRLRIAKKSKLEGAADVSVPSRGERRAVDRRIRRQRSRSHSHFKVQSWSRSEMVSGRASSRRSSHPLIDAFATACVSLQSLDGQKMVTGRSCDARCFSARACTQIGRWCTLEACSSVHRRRSQGALRPESSILPAEEALPEGSEAAGATGESRFEVLRRGAPLVHPRARSIAAAANPAPVAAFVQFVSINYYCIKIARHGFL